MVEEARLEENESGLAPATEGCFVVNVRDAAWLDHDVFGASCMFESPDAEFTELGIRICVLQPDQPNGLYQAWDFFHCAPGTEHIFVGSGESPCVIVMAGTRRPGRPIFYPVSELALRHQAGVEAETPSPKDAYASYSDERVVRPAFWDELPWAN